jgi:hypothetical protein
MFACEWFDNDGHWLAIFDDAKECRRHSLEIKRLGWVVTVWEL